MSLPTCSHFIGALVAIALTSSCDTGATAQTATVTRRDPLPSWNEGPAKGAILDFVARVTTPGTPDYVAPEDRIAVFDNDGTLWSEQPYYNQLAFALDRVRALAPRHPDWKHQQPFQAVLEDDPAALAATGNRGLVKIIAATHAGTTTEEFADIVGTWIASARHPTTGRRYTEMVYQPMLEVLALLRAHGFTTYIVSGGGVEFIRPWSERVYGIPPEHIVGSRAKVVYEVRDGVPVLIRKAEVDLVDDGPGKPVGIHQVIGRRPIAAFGNSDGDYEMLEWTTSAPGPRFGLIVHHTDAKREWAYDREAKVGKLSRALDQAPAKGWTVVDMKRDWRVIFPPPQGPDREQ